MNMNYMIIRCDTPANHEGLAAYKHKPEPVNLLSVRSGFIYIPAYRAILDNNVPSYWVYPGGARLPFIMYPSECRELSDGELLALHLKGEIE